MVALYAAFSFKFRNPWPVQCGANFTGPKSAFPAYRPRSRTINRPRAGQAGAFDWANFFMDDTKSQFLKPDPEVPSMVWAMLLQHGQLSCRWLFFF